MGMYCTCDVKITDSWIDDCNCNWYGWVSIYDWPPPRKNKELPFALPAKEGWYLTRIQSDAGDHYTAIQYYSKETRQVTCRYTGGMNKVHWSGNDEEQPYAWKIATERDYERNDKLGKQVEG